MNAIKQDVSIRPDRQDYEAVANQYGQPPDDRDETVAHWYRLAQAHTLIRINVRDTP